MHSTVLPNSFIQIKQIWLYANPTNIVHLRNIKDKLTGERRTVEAVKRVKQWWFVSDTGKVCLQVRYGTRVLELAKGKNSIEVGNAAELMTVLTAVKSAVEAGDLDAQIDAASAAVRERFAQ